MGMYTELHYNTELKGDIPEEVIAILEYMVGDREDEPPLMEHGLFKTGRWGFMLRCDSYYFDADTHSTLRYDDVSRSYYLCIRSNLKNYDEEISLFVDWIRPYINKNEGDFLGFWRYEESETPELLYA